MTYHQQWQNQDDSVALVVDEGGEGELAREKIFLVFILFHFKAYVSSVFTGYNGAASVRALTNIVEKGERCSRPPMAAP